MNEKPAPKAVALLPVAVFLVLYLVLGIVFGICAENRDGLLSDPHRRCFFGGSAGGMPAKSQCEL